jgi:CDP-glycerol glycerophosphotransferase
MVVGGVRSRVAGRASLLGCRLREQRLGSGWPPRPAPGRSECAGTVRGALNRGGHFGSTADAKWGAGSCEPLPSLVRWVGTRTGCSLPKVSVIVPVYNVERYLDDCLASVAAQSLTDLEVVVVDDGSPDRSIEIADRWASQDRRFTIHRQENHGLGHARNTGARHASGEYLAFLDSDDMVPPRAYELMARSLDETGSVVCTGTVRRLLDSGATARSPMHDGLHRPPEQATRLTSRHTLLRDRLAVNKLWRRSYWQDAEWSFPEGVLYEDIPTIIPALASAPSIDVITDAVYLWRVRSGGPVSITQDRTEVRHLRDRMGGVTSVSRFLDDLGDHELKRAYDLSVLGGDLEIFLNQLDLVDDAYAAETLRLAREYLSTTDPTLLRELAASSRVKYYFAQQDDVDAARDFARFRRSGGLKRTPHVRRRDVVLLDLPQRHTTEGGLPDEILDDTEHLELVTRVLDVVGDPRSVRIEGWAYVRGLPQTHRRAAKLRLLVEDPGSGERVEAKVRRWADPEVTVDDGHSVNRYDWARFRATIPVRSLERLTGGGTGSFPIRVIVTSGRIQRIGRLGRPAPGRARTPGTIDLPKQRMLRPTWSADGLVLKVVQPDAQLSEVRFEGGDLVLGLTTRTSSADSQLQVATPGWKSSFEVRQLGARAGEVRIPVDDLLQGAFPRTHDGTRPSGKAELRFRRHPSKRAKPLPMREPGEGASIPFNDQELVIRPTRRENASLVLREPHPRLRSCRWVEPATLELDLGYSAAADSIRRAEIVSTRGIRRTTAELEVREDGCRLRIPFGGAGEDEAGIPFPQGRWTPELIVDGCSVPIEVPPSVSPQLPAVTTYRSRRYFAHPNRGILEVAVGSELAADERGAHQQHRLQTDEYPRFCRKSLRRAVLFDCHGGRQFADSPRALHDELVARDLRSRYLVTVSDQQAVVPAPSEPVAMWSREHYRAMATSSTVVLNSFQPRWFSPRPEQLVIQTWHGTALKRIGRDSLAVQARGAVELDRMTELAATWSWMVSPSPYMTGIYRSGWGFEGRVLECGYPRNDVFFSPDTGRIARRVRNRFGVSPDQRIILYAPTFRDDALAATRGHAVHPLLDLERLTAHLGDDDVLLVRGHHLSNIRLPSTPGLPVRDASQYPDVQELLVTADALITDYSSVMFDFANTGRPMIFHAPDLDEYRERVRGFYFDLEAVVPGPVCRDDDALEDALRAVGTWDAQYSDRYDAFRERFCPWDDGEAAARLADAVLAEGVLS